jgi:hypothetical protein
MPIASSFTLGDALLTVLELALLFLWIWIAIGVIFDVFRSTDLSGWGKAAWLLVIVIIPLIGVLIYVIARGHKMTEHALAREQDAAVRGSVGSAGASPADDIAKLDELRRRGVISDEEFERAKARALA